MSHAVRQRRNRRPRPRVEALEPRALLATAGSLDPSFGAGYGSSTVPLVVPVTSSLSVEADAVATTPGGQIVVAGKIDSYSGNTANGGTLSVEELNADGTLDTSFGMGGQTQLPSYYGQVFKMAVAPDGGIILATYTTEGGMVTNGIVSYLAMRLNPNGSLDTTFGTNGVAEYPIDTTTPSQDLIENIVAVLPQSNGQIVLAGGSEAGFSAVRLDSNGSLDTTFGTNGTATVSSSAGSYAYFPTGAATQSNGQILIEGTVDTAFSGIAPVVSQVGVARLNADGSVDTTFGGSAAGLVVLPNNPADPDSHMTLGAAIAVQPTTGDALVTGNNGTSYTLYRLTTAGAVDTTFGTSGLVTLALSLTTDVGGMTAEADGDVVLSGYINNPQPNFGLNVYRDELLQLNPDGTPDASFGNTTTPGLLLTGLAPIQGLGPSTADLPAINPTNGDILLAGAGTLRTLDGLSYTGVPYRGPTYGFTVDSILTAATAGPSATAPPPPANADFTGLGYSDLAVYDVPTGSFLVQSAIQAAPISTADADYSYAFGPEGAGMTIPAAADYQGIGYDQLGAYLPQSGTYAILPSLTSPGLAIQFGSAGAGQTIPVPADYQGTGKADVAVYLVAQGTFAIIPADGGAPYGVQFGIGGAGQSIPAPADYYGTGQADIAVYLAQYGEFAVQDPTGKTSGEVVPFGMAGVGKSIPVPGDYDGSGHVEIAVYIPSLGAYFYRPYAGGADVEVKIGTANSGELPVPGDYDGTGRTEAAIYDPAGGFFEYQPAVGGPVVTIDLGRPGDQSLPIAAPAGALPEFAASGGSGGMGIKLGGIVAPGGGPGSASPNSVTVSRAAAVPAGPTLASIRVPRALVNQAAPDPLKLA